MGDRSTVRLDPAGERVRGLAANLHVRVLGGEVDQLLSDRRRQDAAPLRLARHTPERMCGVTTHSRYRVIKEARDCLDGARIGNMIEHLDAPPTDPRILVGQSPRRRRRRRLASVGFSQVGGRHVASETAEGLDLTTPLAELLHEELFRCHRGEDTRRAVLAVVVLGL